MSNLSKRNKTSWKPGESGNPKGRIGFNPSKLFDSKLKEEVFHSIDKEYLIEIEGDHYIISVQTPEMLYDRLFEWTSSRDVIGLKSILYAIDKSEKQNQNLKPDPEQMLDLDRLNENEFERLEFLLSKCKRDESTR